MVSSPLNADDWSWHPSLQPLRYESAAGEFIALAGLLPYCDAGDRRLYLLTRPRAWREGNARLPLQLSRGHRKMRGADGVWRDIRTETEAAAARRIEGRPGLVSDPLATALEEAEEELGLARTEVIEVADAGTLAYVNAEGRRYGIRFYVARLRSECVFPPPDAEESVWMDEAAIEAAVKQGEFKRNYFLIIRGLIACVRTFRPF